MFCMIDNPAISNTVCPKSARNTFYSEGPKISNIKDAGKFLRCLQRSSNKVV